MKGIGMKEEYAVTREQMREVCALILEYLEKGGTGFDADLLDKVIVPFMWADRIRIVYAEEDLDDEN
jgi:hypothetical protein